MFNTKKRKLRILQSHLDIIYNGIFPEEYLETHKNRINCLEWLVAYYEGRASATPQLMLEVYISKSNPTIADCHWATTLWYWIYKNEIYRF